MRKPKKIKPKRASQGNYPNAVKKSDFDNIVLYTELEGLSTPEEPKYLYFRPLPAALRVPIEDPAKSGMEKWRLMVQAVSIVVIDPDTSKPLMTESEWHQQDSDTLRSAIGAVFGVSFGSDDDEDDESVLTPDEQARLEALAAEPNPLGETIGSGSLTVSISDSGEETAT